MEPTKSLARVMSREKIGDINGPWAILFRITQILVPIAAITLIPWTIWVTSTMYAKEIRIVKLEMFAGVGPRYTAETAESLRLRIMSDVEIRIASSTTKIADRIDNLTAEIILLKLELTRHRYVTTGEDSAPIPAKKP